MFWLCGAWLQVLVMLCFPLFSYAGVVGTASGMVDLKDMKPLLNRLRPSSRELMVRRMKQMFGISCNFLLWRFFLTRSNGNVLHYVAAHVFATSTSKEFSLQRI